jgi:hypothetical protein
MVGLFLIAVAPGAPLMTRNAAKRGFDMQMAASYQVWSALLVPIMIPLLVGGAALLYQRDIWISPLEVLMARRAETIRPATGRGCADAFRTRLFHESAASAERRWQRSADRGVDRALDKNGTGSSKRTQPVGL